MKPISKLLILILLCELSFAQSRTIINSSFEYPVFDLNTVLFAGAQNDPTPTVPGWYTTNGAYNGFQHPIELWSSGYSGVVAQSGIGNQFAEINCSENSRIYQIVCLIQGEKIDWNFYHRGRSGTDVCEFNVYSLDGTTKLQVFQTATTPQSWKNYQGFGIFNHPTGFYQISFESVATATHNPAVGNFIDGIKITFNPVVEFIQASYAGVEHVGNNLPRIRIKGTVPVGGMNLTFAIAGGTTTPGLDYNLNSSLIIPEGEYSGSAAVYYTLPLTIYDEDLIELDETVLISIIAADAGGQLLDANCDGQTLLTINYKIINDDECSTPAVQCNLPIPFCVGDTAVLHVTGVANVEWSTGEKTLEIKVSNPGKFIVTAFDHNCVNKDSIIVATKICDCNVIVPTAFSPNGDGMNDLFRPLNANKCKIEEIELIVFNRSGDLIYSSTDIHTAWDGTYNGKPVPIGVYVWTLDYKVHGENSELPLSGNLNGNVTLLR